MQNIDKLLNIMRALRDPVSGCPWDLQQDFRSIAAWTLEEAYEVLDAINSEDYEELRDELGDLLFQVIYHAQMASEQGKFDFIQVVDSINDKLIRRHPHVFGEEMIDNAEEQSRRWDRIKREEKGVSKTASPNSMLAGISLHQPAMRRAEKLQQKAATIGFDWETIKPVFAKVREELTELEQAIQDPDRQQEKILNECGDLMFVIVNLARKLGINPELALGRANSKFIRRFMYIEEQLAATGITLEDATLEKMDSLWDEAKKLEQEDFRFQGL